MLVRLHDFATASESMKSQRNRQGSWAALFLGKRRPERPESTEERWGKDSKTEFSPRRAMIVGAVMGVIGVGLLVSLYQVVSRDPDHPIADQSAVGEDEVFEQQIEAAEKLAKKFLAETDPEQRIQWVRKPEQVREHMAQWSETVLCEPGEIERMLGHSDTGGRLITCFVVRQPDGGMRLLEVVDSGDGLRVDWDAYARHCSADWPAIIEGRVERAEVRVSASPGTYHNPPFADVHEWTCFQLTSPDLPGRIHAYARKGTLRETRMRAIILGSPGYRQHMMLRIVRREGPDGESLFEIERALAIGWVRGEADVEAEWEAGGVLVKPVAEGAEGK